MSEDGDKHKAARGALPWQPGDEPAEATIRRIRGGDTERIAELEAEIAVLADAIARLEAAIAAGPMSRPATEVCDER